MSFADFTMHYKKWKNFKILFGCAMAWFFLDIAFYGLGLNQSIVLDAIGFVKKDNVYEVISIFSSHEQYNNQ